MKKINANPCRCRDYRLLFYQISKHLECYAEQTHDFSSISVPLSQIKKKEVNLEIQLKIKL